MTARENWIRNKSLSRREFRHSGGCSWDRQPNSPGNSLRVPAGTRFRIAIGGPTSELYAYGNCSVGSFVIDEGPCTGRYDSANAAVVAARPHVESRSSNAYLYIEFEVDDRFIGANQLRYDPDLSIPFDPVEEEALDLAARCYRRDFPGDARELNLEQLREKAEEILAGMPKPRERAREIVALRDSVIDL